MVPKSALTSADIPNMTSRIESETSCSLCENAATYLTPFGMLCQGHSDQVVGRDSSWLPIPLTGSHVTPGLRRRLKP